MIQVWRLLLLATCLAGCAHYQMACPHDGGPRWTELTSAHFALRTDLPEREARDIIRESEKILASFVEAAEFFLPPTSDVGRTTIVMFAEHWEYQRVLTAQEVRNGSFELGRTMFGDELARPMIVLAADVHASEVFRHELTHRLVHQRIGAVPLWLDEGLAEYFSQIRIVGDKVALGALTTRLQRIVQRERNSNTVGGVPLLPLGTVAARAWPDALVDPCYLDAWALVHYLANGAPDHADRFRRFLAAIADGRAAGEALQAEYGAAELIEAGYRAHAQQFITAKALQWLIPFTRPAPNGDAPLRRFLDDAEVHEMKAQLLAKSAARELELARAHGNESSPAFHRWLARVADAAGDKARAEEEMVRAVALAPDDSSFLYERARLRMAHELGKPQSERHLDAVDADVQDVADRVDEPRQLDLIARFFSAEGDTARGLQFSQRAVGMEPQCAACIATLASLYFAQGDLLRAVDAQETALRRWPDKQKVPAELTTRLEEYRRARQGRRP